MLKINTKRLTSLGLALSAGCAAFAQTAPAGFTRADNVSTFTVNPSTGQAIVVTRNGVRTALEANQFVVIDETLFVRQSGGIILQGDALASQSAAAASQSIGLGSSLGTLGTLTGVGFTAGFLGEQEDSAITTPTAPSMTTTVTASVIKLGLNGTSTITFTFSESVTGFDTSDVIIDPSFGTLGTLSANADNTVFTGLFEANGRAVGAIDVSIADGTFTDSAGLSGPGTTVNSLMKVHTSDLNIRTNDGGETSSGNSDPEYLTPKGDNIYFSATGEDGHTDLFVLNTTNSTVTDLNVRTNDGGKTSSGNSDPKYLTPIGDNVYLRATGEDGHTDLFVLNTTNNTITDLNVRTNDGGKTSNGDSNPFDFTQMGNILYFSASGNDGHDDLFSINLINNNIKDHNIRTKDGGNTSSGHSSPSKFVSIGDVLYFQGTADDGHFDLFSYDTKNNTLIDFNVRTSDGGNTSSGDSFPTDLTQIGNNLYFNARGDDGYRDLFVLDITSNTVTDLDIWKSSSGTISKIDSNPEYFTKIGDTLFFSAKGGDNHRDLFYLDSKNNKITDLNIKTSDNGQTSNGNSYPVSLTEVGDVLYFSATGNDGHVDLFSFDIINNSKNDFNVFTNNGGQNSSGNSFPSYITKMGDNLYFSAIGVDTHDDLFSLNLTNNTVTDHNIFTSDAGKTSNGNFLASDLTAIGSNLYIKATGQDGHTDLFVFDPMSFF